MGKEIKFIRPKWYRYDNEFDDYYGRYARHCKIHYVCEEVEETLLHLQGNNNNNKKRKRGREDLKVMKIPSEQDDMMMIDEGRDYCYNPKRSPYNPNKLSPLGMAINEGDQFDIPTLLSSSFRDYLINNKGDKIKIKDHVFGKRVLLYIWNLADYRDLHNSILFEDSKEIYREYNLDGHFEIVFVALGDNRKVFDKAFSVMPWLAIPHEDQEGRDLIEKKFAIAYSSEVRSVLFDLDGTVLLDSCGILFRLYGPEGFPFTRERIAQVDDADEALEKELLSSKEFPLEKVLGEFVLSREGNQVRTSDLEDHVIGLHIFDPWSREDDHYTNVLIKTWKSLKDDPSTKFAIISVNAINTGLSYIKNKYPERYRDIRWYKLPYDGRRLSRILRSHHLELENGHGNHFIIIEPDRYQTLNYFALEVVESYGIGAFPFTLERAMEIEKTMKTQTTKLCKLLSPSAPLHRGCSTRHKECTVSELLGKRVLLLFATNSCYRAGPFLHAVQRIYIDKKGTKDHFEIIYISLDCIESQTSFRRSIKKMPWLIHSFVPKFALHLIKEVFGCIPRLPAIAAFGSTGNLQAIESNLLYKETWSAEYPFIRADMDDYVCRELIAAYRWDLERVFPRYYSSDEEEWM